jgi:outer membrane protein TolC
MRSYSILAARFIALSWLAVSTIPCSAGEPLKLSLQEAIRLALLPAGQAKLQLVAEAERMAQSQLQQVRSAIALHVDGDLSDRVLRFDLRSIGVDLPQVSPFVANVELPNVVGPFTVMDAEVRLTKSVLNRSVAHQVQAARESLESVKTQNQGVSAEIVAQTARAYLDALRAKSEADLATENVKLSEGSVSLADERKANGTVTGAEVRHANLDLAEARQKLFSAQTAYPSAILQLVALIGIPFDTPVELTDQPVYRPENTTLREALEKALKSRVDLTAAGQDIEALRLKERAVAAEALPSLTVFANAGELTGGADAERGHRYCFFADL